MEVKQAALSEAVIFTQKTCSVGEDLTRKDNATEWTDLENGTEVLARSTVIDFVNLQGLLHYPTCRAQLKESTWSEVGRTHDLPQMTHLEVGKSGRRNLAPAVFVYLTFIIDEIGQLNNIKDVPKLTQDLNLIENTVFSIDYVIF